MYTGYFDHQLKKNTLKAFIMCCFVASVAFSQRGEDAQNSPAGMYLETSRSAVCLAGNVETGLVETNVLEPLDSFIGSVRSPVTPESRSDCSPIK